MTLAALAVNMPGHVLQEASSTHLLHAMPLEGERMLSARQDTSMLQSDVPGLSHLHQTAEAAVYPITEAYASMVQTLLEAGLSNGDMKVGFALLYQDPCTLHGSCEQLALSLGLP